MIARWQLLRLGFTAKAIDHRIARGRLHPIWRGVYAVGRPRVSRRGRWMAAVLACGTEAALSHESAAALWGIRDRERRGVEVSVPMRLRRTRPGITIPRRSLTAQNFRLNASQTERAVNEADKLDLVDPEQLREALEHTDPRPGLRPLRKLLDYRTFTMTDSENEQRFLPIARKAGLPKPKTQQRVNGFRVDFYRPDLELVVETDGLRYHRTPAEQAADLLSLSDPPGPRSATTTPTSNGSCPT